MIVVSIGIGGATGGLIYMFVGALRDAATVMGAAASSAVCANLHGATQQEAGRH